MTYIVCLPELLRVLLVTTDIIQISTTTNKIPLKYQDY